MKGDPQEAQQTSTSPFDRAMSLVALVVPALLAATGALPTAPASHDEAVTRVVGLGWTGPLRALDVVVSAPLMLVPIGTHSLRAALASAIVTGVASALAFSVARRFIGMVVPAVFARWPGPPASPKLASAVAVVAVLGAALGPAWQSEGSVPGGAVTGGLLAIAALYCAEIGAPRGSALLVGLAASYEPFLFLSVLLASAPSVRDKPDRAATIDAAAAFLLGLAPFGVAAALSRRTPELSLAATSLFARPGRPGLGSVTSAGVSEIGSILLVAALAGAALAVTVPEARRKVLSLAGVVLAGAVALSVGALVTNAAVLAAITAAMILAGVALTSLVVAIARAPVPFAQASAALVVVLELVVPVRFADETMGKRESRAPRAASIWSEIAWGSAPPAAAVLVADRLTMRRIVASRAVGEMRTDLVIVPTFDIGGALARRALATEPKLAPLYRDIVLGSAPEELSLAQVATVRPVLSGYDVRWDRALARHLVPVGLTSRFEPEPRGVSDRKRAMDTFAPAKDRLVRVAVARRDVDLAAATAQPLRNRAVAMAACGEREMLARALDDLRPFAPEDAVASTLVRRTVTSKGAIDVHDLGP